MKELTCDLLVIGGAGGGLSAAVKARQLGAEKVILIDKNPAFGGCTKMAAGIFALNSPLQNQRGFYYDVDECYQELMVALNWQVDALLVRKWLRGSGESIRWLQEMGMVFDDVGPFNGLKEYVRSTYHISRVNDFHTGAAIIRTLVAEAERLGVELYTRTRATHLIRGEDGAVHGAYATDKDGEELKINAGAVIMSTGSVSANRELIARFYASDEYKDIRIMADVPHNTGDGFLMAEEIGGGKGLVSTLYIGPQNHYPGASEITGSEIRRPYPLRINRNGERVSDESWCGESEFGWMIGVNIDKQPGKVIYGVLDQACLDYQRKYDNKALWLCEEYSNKLRGYDPDTSKCVWLERFADECKQQESVGLAKVCNTYEEIAEFIGCPVETLTDTLTRYNEYCARGYDEELLKDPKYMFPISTPPYYVVKGASGIDTCIGGLLIDNYQRVLDRDQYVIPGLYAAGVLTSGWCGHNYAFFGSEMSYTIYSGRTAGENALKYIRK